MKTSARNVFHGTISQIEQREGMYQITVQSGDLSIRSHISPFAYAHLQPMSLGQHAVVMLKASAMLLMTDLPPFRLSAENCLRGKVRHIVCGAVNNLITLELEDGQMMTAVITLHSTEHLDIHLEQEMYAVFPASSTVLGLV